MSVPTYDKFIEPVLRYLALHPEGVRARDAHEAAADALGLDESARQLTVPTGQPLYNNRAGWAHDRLKRAGLSSSPKRGLWQISPEGKRFITANPRQLSEEQVHELARGYIGVRLRASPDDASGVPESPQVDEEELQSPDDRLQVALEQIRASVAAELLELLSQVTPKYFETVVLDVLHKLGYGTRRSDLQRVGGSGDAGIDGIISLDRLGLEKVYVQAKRWQGVVGRPEIQGFYGALAGQRANKGVFITTSSFTSQAVEFARSIESIVLVNGETLAALMMDYEVGVQARKVSIPAVDSDYFGE